LIIALKPIISDEFLYSQLLGCAEKSKIDKPGGVFHSNLGYFFGFL